MINRIDFISSKIITLYYFKNNRKSLKLLRIKDDSTAICESNIKPRWCLWSSSCKG